MIYQRDRNKILIIMSCCLLTSFLMEFSILQFDSPQNDQITSSQTLLHLEYTQENISQIATGTGTPLNPYIIDNMNFINATHYCTILWNNSQSHLYIINSTINDVSGVEEEEFIFQFYNSSNIFLQDNIFYDIKFIIKCYSVSNFVLRNTHFIGHSYPSINTVLLVYNLNDSIIENCNFHNVVFGILLYSQCNNIEIINNRLNSEIEDRSKGFGIDFGEYCENVSITNNEICNFERGLYIVGKNVHISNNYISNNHFGIYIRSDSSNITLSYNKFYYNMFNNGRFSKDFKNRVGMTLKGNRYRNYLLFTYWWAFLLGIAIIGGNAWYFIQKKQKTKTEMIKKE